MSFAEAGPGDYVGFNVPTIDVKTLRRGFVASDINNDPAREAVSFIAQVRSIGVLGAPLSTRRCCRSSF